MLLDRLNTLSKDFKETLICKNAKQCKDSLKAFLSKDYKELILLN